MKKSDWIFYIHRACNITAWMCQLYPSCAICPFCLMWQEQSVVLYLIIDFQYSPSTLKVVSEVGWPWSSWTTRKIEVKRPLQCSKTQSSLFGHPKSIALGQHKGKLEWLCLACYPSSLSTRAAALQDCKVKSQRYKILLKKKMIGTFNHI